MPMHDSVYITDLLAILSGIVTRNNLLLILKQINKCLSKISLLENYNVHYYFIKHYCYCFQFLPIFP